jgi:hypothetical protein
MLHLSNFTQSSKQIQYETVDAIYGSYGVKHIYCAQRDIPLVMPWSMPDLQVVITYFCINVCATSMRWEWVSSTHLTDEQYSTYLLCPWNSVLLEKLIGFQLVRIFPAFYEIRRFINAITTARHLSLLWASSIQSTPLSHFLNIHLNIILPSTPGSSKWYR